MSKYRFAILALVFICICNYLYTDSGSSLKLANASSSDSEGEPVLYAYSTSDLVFIGSVQSIEPFDKYQQFVQFNVSKVWKGGVRDEILVNDYDDGCKSRLELSREYLVYATIQVSSPTPADAEYYAIDKSGKIIGLWHCGLAKTIDQAGFDLLALEFINGNNSTAFQLTDDVNGYNYTLYGRHTDGITVKKLSIAPEYGIGIEISTDSYDSDRNFGLMELSLPKNVIDGVQYYEWLISDFSQSDYFHFSIANETHNTVIFPVAGGTYSVFVHGTSVVPEFSSSFIVAIIGVAITVAFFFVSGRYRIGKRV